MPYYVHKTAANTPILFNPKESKINGFWSVLEVKGSHAPTSRENAALLLSNWHG